MSGTLLRVCPSELKIPYEVKRPRSCCMQLTNKTDRYVAFKVKTTNPRRYSVRHTCGVLLPRSSCSVTVTMQAPREMPLDYHCRDKFLVQSAEVRDGATVKDFVPGLFTKAPGRLIEEFKLRVVYIAVNPPSPVPEEAEEEDDASPRYARPEEMGYEDVKMPSVSDDASSCTGKSGADLSCAESVSAVSSLVGERVYVADENQKLQQEMGSFTKMSHCSARDMNMGGVNHIVRVNIHHGHAVHAMSVLYERNGLEWTELGGWGAEATPRSICAWKNTSPEWQKMWQRGWAVGSVLASANELLREARSSQQGFSVAFVLLVFMSSVFIGHLMKHIKV